MTPEQNRSEELLRRWISGAITAPEEAELERRASGDDGLREAFEALRDLPEADHHARIEAMVARGQPAQGQRRKLFPRYAAAAATLLLLGIATLLLPHYYAEEETAAIAMESAPVTEEPSSPPTFTAPAPRRPPEVAEAVDPIPPQAEVTQAEKTAPQTSFNESREMDLVDQDSAEPVIAAASRRGLSRVADEFRARPAEGYPTLRERIVTERPDDLPTGEVRVEFLVNPDGSLSDLRFPDEPGEPTVNYVTKALVESTWESLDRSGPVRVYLTLQFE
ncbi:hypothetical protein GGR28_002688 [Lewinella aquimaris]|uniref:TonB C-terminal domain-containing protein n=1 Tax=Neolewinella aquimaris TaxID=1835722 RepID=A0A840EDL9_9BACT|nr:hypothetical protein [Neolewinella aquimaris]MBB4080058.1 hypothetical protein [Neolewinella aquimaris]